MEKHFPAIKNGHLGGTYKAEKTRIGVNNSEFFESS